MEHSEIFDIRASFEQLRANKERRIRSFKSYNHKFKRHLIKLEDIDEVPPSRKFDNDQDEFLDETGVPVEPTNPKPPLYPGNQRKIEDQ